MQKKSAVGFVNFLGVNNFIEKQNNTKHYLCK